MLPQPRLVGRRARALIPAQPRQALPAPRAMHGQARCAFCQPPGNAGQTAELQACPGGNGGASCSAAVLEYRGVLQQEPGGFCPGIPPPSPTAPASPQQTQTGPTALPLKAGAIPERRAWP